MLIVVAGLLVLLCVSTVQLVWNYHKGISPLDLPRNMQKYVRGNVIYDFKTGVDHTWKGLLMLLVIIAYPLTYILTVLGYYLYKLYNTVKGAFSKYF